MVLFLKMVEGTVCDESLVKRLRTDIRMQLSARHVPALILPITDIPVSYIYCSRISRFEMKIN